MRKSFIGIGLSLILLTGCVSIPKETITLSQTIGTDLQTLRQSHKRTIQLYYNEIRKDIESFLNEKYAPYLIHYALRNEIEKGINDSTSLHFLIRKAGESKNMNDSEEALAAMSEFQEAANAKVAEKKAELLNPLEKQEKEVINKVDFSYQKTINANNALTAYLSSAHKIKETQDNILSKIGLKEERDSITNGLVKLSNYIEKVTQKAKQIDIKSDEATQKIKDTFNEFKELTNTKL